MLQTWLYIQIIRVNFLPARLSEALSHKHHFLGPSEQTPSVIIAFKAATGSTSGSAGPIKLAIIVWLHDKTSLAPRSEHDKCLQILQSWFGSTTGGSRLPVLWLWRGIWCVPQPALCSGISSSSPAIGLEGQEEGNVVKSCVCRCFTAV